MSVRWPMFRWTATGWWCRCGADRWIGTNANTTRLAGQLGQMGAACFALALLPSTWPCGAAAALELRLDRGWFTTRMRRVRAKSTGRRNTF